jgi:hypothetical protein
MAIQFGSVSLASVYGHPNRLNFQLGVDNIAQYSSGESF